MSMNVGIFTFTIPKVKVLLSSAPKNVLNQLEKQPLSSSKTRDEIASLGSQAQSANGKAKSTANSVM